jgi:polar amino acid transport system permease protein
VNIYVQLFRCTPLLVQIVWFFYALPMLTGWQVTAWVAAGTGLTLYMGSFATEIFRAGIMSIDKGQRQAAQSIGMNYYQTMRYIVLPQAMRRMIPPTVSQSILQLKNTSLLYIVAVPDLMYTASQITAQTYRPLETYTFVALMYLVVLYPLTVFSKRLESRDDQ